MFCTWSGILPDQFSAMERVLPVRQGSETAWEVFPLLALWAVDSPERCLGGRQMACSMPELRRVLAGPSTHCSNLHWRCMDQDTAGTILADNHHSWSMGQCTAGSFLSGSLHLWSMVLCTADMQNSGTLHMD